MIYKATIGYLGKNYYGFAKQKQELTVQGELERCLSKILNKPVKTMTAARTDTGVSALANVIAFEEKKEIDLYKLRWGLNGNLPEDIVVSSVEKMPDGFNPRRNAKSRVYSYYILNRKQSSVFNANTCFHVPRDISFTDMKKASLLLKGRHNFRSFCSYMPREKTYTREIKVLKIEKSSDFFDVDKKDLVKITIEAESFLYNMVRVIVGTLLEVGTGKRNPQDMQKILKAKDRRSAGKTAPAHGLVLVEVKY